MAEFPALPLFTDAFLGDTLHLNAAQIGAYMLMLMTAWRSSDCTLQNDDIYLSRICRMDKRTWMANKGVLLAFWLSSDDAKLFQKRLKDERKYVCDIRNKNSAAGRASALKRKDRHSTTVATKPQPEPNPHTLPIPLSKISKKESKCRGTRFTIAQCPEDWIQFCQNKRPDLNPNDVFDSFRDWWIAKAGAGGTKLDWDATWRNWVRNQKLGSTNGNTHSKLPSKPTWASEGQRLAAMYAAEAEREEQAAAYGDTKPSLRIAESIREDSG